jgi:hypothetical protein
VITNITKILADTGKILGTDKLKIMVSIFKNLRMGNPVSRGNYLHSF